MEETIDIDYNILYTNGHKETIQVKSMTEEQREEIRQVIVDSFRSDYHGYLELNGVYIRLSQVARIISVVK